jgi:hypothetical protein
MITATHSLIGYVVPRVPLRIDGAVVDLPAPFGPAMTITWGMLSPQCDNLYSTTNGTIKQIPMWK